MNTRIAAFIIFAASVYGIASVVAGYRRDRLSTRILFVWVFLWSATGGFALFPSLLDRIMGLVNIGNRPFFITLCAILTLFVIVFHISAYVSKLNQRILRLVQEVAFLKYAQKYGEDGAEGDGEGGPTG